MKVYVSVFQIDKIFFRYVLPNEEKNQTRLVQATGEIITYKSQLDSETETRD